MDSYSEHILYNAGVAGRILKLTERFARGSKPRRLEALPEDASGSIEVSLREEIGPDKPVSSCFQSLNARQFHLAVCDAEEVNSLQNLGAIQHTCELTSIVSAVFEEQGIDSTYTQYGIILITRSQAFQ